MRDYKCIIKELGLDKNLDVTKLCERLDISRTTYYNVINNVKEPSVGLAIHLTREVNYKLSFYKWLDIDDLFVPDYIRENIINGELDKVKELYPNIVAWLDFIKKES